MSMTGEAIEAAAEALAGARQTGRLIDGLPPEMRPATAVEAHAIQDATLRRMGVATGALKVNAFPQGGFVRGTVPADRVLASPARISIGAGICGLESEIAFLFPEGVPPREAPWRRDEAAALAAALPAFDVVESRFTRFMERSQLERTADCLSAGWFIRGAVRRDWQQIDLTGPELRIDNGGRAIFDAIGRHPLADPFLPVLRWLEAHRAEGCAAGTIVTTGSYAGLIKIAAGDRLTARFAGFAPIELEVVA